MKLSKAQQEVVDKMREGYALKHTDFSTWLKHDLTGLSCPVSCRTFNALCRMGVIEDSLNDSPPSIYRLTEQYKNKPE